MFTLSSKRKQKRNWLQRGFSTTLEIFLRPSANEVIPEHSLKIFLAHFLRNLPLDIPYIKEPDFFGEKHDGAALLNNIRGRFQRAHPEEQILLLEGHIEEEENEVEEPVKSPCSFSITSQFHKIVSSAEITYAINNNYSSLFSAIGCETSAVGVLENELFHIAKANFALEFLGPHYFSSLLGLAPVLKQKCYLSLSLSEITILLHEECSKNKEQMPFKDSPIVDAIDTALSVAEFFQGLKTTLVTNRNIP